MVVVGGGYIGMEAAAAAAGWKLDTTVHVNFNFHALMIIGLVTSVYRANICLWKHSVICAPLKIYLEYFYQFM